MSRQGDNREGVLNRDHFPFGSPPAGDFYSRQLACRSPAKGAECVGQFSSSCQAPAQPCTIAATILMQREKLSVAHTVAFLLTESEDLKDTSHTVLLLPSGLQSPLICTLLLTVLFV